MREFSFLLKFKVAIEHFVPREALFVELFHERIGVELFYVPHTRTFPDALEEHHGTYHGGYTGGVAYALHASFLVSFLVATVVVDIVGAFLAVFHTTDAASDGSFAFVVLAEILWVGEYGFEELEGDYLHTVVYDGFDAGHADVLNDTQMG